jgi:predicted Zn-dependent protease
VTSRIDIFRQLLENDPANGNILFGLAKEYEKLGLDHELIDILNRYLAGTDDEGNAFGMLARAHERAGQRELARAAYEGGIAAAEKHGHPSMAEEYRTTLASDYED